MSGEGDEVCNKSRKEDFLTQLKHRWFPSPVRKLGLDLINKVLFPNSNPSAACATAWRQWDGGGLGGETGTFLKGWQMHNPFPAAEWGCHGQKQMEAGIFSPPPPLPALPSMLSKVYPTIQQKMPISGCLILWGQRRLALGSPHTPVKGSSAGNEEFLNSRAPSLSTFSHIQWFGLPKEKQPCRGTGWDLLASWASFLVCEHHVVQSVVNTVKGSREAVGSPSLELHPIKAQPDKVLGNLI